jgi:hypothetical protein
MAFYFCQLPQEAALLQFEKRQVGFGRLAQVLRIAYRLASCAGTASLSLTIHAFLCR